MDENLQVTFWRYVCRPWISVSIFAAKCKICQSNWHILKLNDEKTEVLHLTSRFRSRLQLPIVKVDNSPIVPSDKVKNLGVIFDRHMVMDRFVSLKCKSASFQLHRLGKIRQYLDTTTAKKLVQALVLCHLDYCNSLLYNMPDSQLGKLQIIQNSAARLITGTKKYSPITPVLQQLHWLPVKSRISFKILLLTFQCLHNVAPSYLQELLKKYTPVRSYDHPEGPSRMPKS